ncbi:MAG: hypothetical protein ACYDBP_10935 [Leptospirales bacterium]
MVNSRVEKNAGETPRRRLGVVGSWEKGPNGLDISLEKFQKWGSVEVYCRLEEYAPLTLVGTRVRIEVSGLVWRGELTSSRPGHLTASPGFTPRDFADEVGTNTVGHYLVSLDKETPATPEIIGATVYLDLCKHDSLMNRHV